MDTKKLIERFTQLLLQADPDLQTVEIRLVRRVTTTHLVSETITREKPDQVPTPVAPTPAPELKNTDETRKKPSRPYVAHPITNGFRLTRDQVGRVKYKLSIGAKICTLAEIYGCSDSLISGIKHGRLWKSIPVGEADDILNEYHARHQNQVQVSISK